MKVNIKELALKPITWFGAAGNFDCAWNQKTRPGFYLFFDGSRNQWPQFGHEKGIFIDEKRYIPLDSLNPSLMSKEQLLDYCAKKGLRIPYLCELVPLLRRENEFTAVQLVNYAFDGYNRKDCRLPEDIIDAFWYQEALENAAEMDQRRLLLIENISNEEVAESMVFTEEKSNEVCVFVTSEAEVWCRNHEKFAAKNFEILLKSPEIQLLTVESKFLFRLDTGVLTYIGYYPERIGSDVITCSEGVFQIYGDELICLLSQNAYAGFDEKGQLVLNVYNEFYGGGEQWVKENYTHYYQRNEKGIWINVGNTYR